MRQWDEEKAIREVIADTGREGDGQAGLADSARPGQGDEAVVTVGENRLQISQLARPPDQRRKLVRQSIPIARGGEGHGHPWRSAID